MAKSNGRINYSRTRGYAGFWSGSGKVGDTYYTVQIAPGEIFDLYYWQVNVGDRIIGADWTKSLSSAKRLIRQCINDDQYVIQEETEYFWKERSEA